MESLVDRLAKGYAPLVEKQAIRINPNPGKLARVQAWLGKNTFAEYLGVETYQWSIAEFQHWIDTVSPDQPDVAYIKVGEYGQEWYGGKFPDIRKLFIDKGIGVAPYVFCRPQFLEKDLIIATNVAQLCGGVVLDCEEQWINNNSLLYLLIGRLRDMVGPSPVILITGYGDPVTAVPSFDFGALHPADGYQPQWYLGWWDIYHEKGYPKAITWGDGQCYQQFKTSGLGADFPIQPAMNVQGVAPGDIAPIVRYLLQWQTGVTVWEAQSIPATMRKVIKDACKS